MMTMETDKTASTDMQDRVIQWVQQAQHGDQQSLNHLAQVARDRLRVYVYRLTLQDDLTQDIVQESLLEMCKILGKLQNADRFWAWLYGIATNKLHRHYRTQKAMRHAAAAEERRRGPMKEREEGFEDLVGEELRQIVSNAMQKLRTRHKAVLVMRCYDGMSYGEIAESMGCSEFSTRMLFVRAKRALQKELLSNGFHKGALLSALIVFGKMTAPSKAAAAQLTVPAAVLKTGLAAGVAGWATTTTGIVSVAAAGALTVGTVVTTSGPGGAVRVPVNQMDAGAQVVSPYGTDRAGLGQYWYYFPEGPQGPLMLRAQARAGALAPQVLQNDQMNYSHEDGTVRINNHRMWLNDLSVFKLPTDGPVLRGFLAQVEGLRNEIPPVADKSGSKGLLVVVERNEPAQKAAPWTMNNLNVLDEDYFQSDWPTGARIVDNRDAMHKRGWTYFRVRGTVRGQEIAGTGRLPFVYAAARNHSAWLRLKIGPRLALVDGGSSAVMQDANGTTLGKYPQGSFFKGLCRPWMGLHSLDTVRRDAAEQRVRFETRLLADGREAEVTLLRDKTKLVYTIDVEADLIREIRFLVGNAEAGTLEFEYLDNVDGYGSEFAAPGTQDARISLQNGPGLLWLVRLADGALGG